MQDQEIKRGQIVSGPDAKAFVLAGNARFTLVSRRTGARFTFRARRPREGAPVFVGVLTGPDNETAYSFMGTIFPKDLDFRFSPKSRVGPDAPSAKAFGWAWRHLRDEILPDQMEFWHEGRCCRCGRVLTVPESVERGIGPECWTKMNMAA